jgi:hypothetical protein
MSAQEPWTEEQRVTLAALGELPAETLTAAERERLHEIAATVEKLQSLYTPPEEQLPIPGEMPGEFQLARMEQARQQAWAARQQAVPVAARTRHSPLWTRLALAAAVVLLASVSYQIMQQGSPTDLAHHSPAEDPYIGTRSGSGGEVPATNASADVQALAPLGDIRIARPLLFIWKSPPTKKWTLRLYRGDESAPLAVADQVSSPLPLEQVPGAEAITTGGSFRWELIDPASGTIAATSTFQVAADARELNPANNAEAMAALQAAQLEGRPSEALMLLFSQHETLATETFITLRKELEVAILKK